MTQQELEIIREFFSHDKFAKQSGFYIESVDDSQSVCSCKISDIHINANGFVMGGVYFSLGDFAFAVARNWMIALGGQERVTVAVNNTIQYMRPKSNGTLFAHAIPLKCGKSMSFYRIDITDEEGTLVAQMNCTGRR